AARCRFAVHVRQPKRLVLRRLRLSGKQTAGGATAPTVSSDPPMAEEPQGAANFPADGVYFSQDANDHDLVARCLAGETAAFEPIVERYQRVLFTVALRMLGDRAEAADATQNAFVSAYRKLGTFDPQRRFFSWLYRI